MKKITFFRLTLLCCALALISCGGGGGSEPKDGSMVNTNTSTVSVSDQHASAADQTVNANVALAAATAVADYYTADSGMVLSVPAPGVLGNDLISGAVNIVRSTQARYGTVALNSNGSFTYRSRFDFGGTDSFTYTIRDSGGNESTAKVTLSVANGFPLPAERVTAIVDLGGMQVAKYKDNKRAAASYTFDDALFSQFAIAGIFETRGLRASFYVTTNNIDAPTWQYWRGLSDKGFEIGNHSMSHIDLSNSALSDADVDREINGAQQIIEQKTGVRPLVFVFPMGLYSTRSLNVTYTNHVATRLPGFPSDYREFPIGESTTVSLANTVMTDAINIGEWVTFAGHGIDGNGWSPIPSQVLKSHLDFASSMTASVWIDTFVNVARYRLCREQVQPQTSLLNPDLAVIRLAGNYSSSLCTKQLTVTLPVIKLPNGTLTARNAAGERVPVTIVDNVLTLNIYPGEEIRLSVTPASQ